MSGLVATQKMERTLPFILQWDESLDTGVPVHDQACQTPFPCPGKIGMITL